jgi:hypothetical protein
MRTFSLALLALTTAALAQPQPVATPVPPATAAVKEISPGIYQIGPAKLDKAKRSVTFPGAVNMEIGALEYLLVTPKGPTHESLLVTDFPPHDLHVAMLLLGAKGNPAPKAADAAPPQITAEYLKHAPELAGQSVEISVAWKDASGAEKTGPVEDWLIFGEKNDSVARGPWLYTGSMFGPTTGQFLADAEGVVAALVTNPSALINNPRPGHDDDKAWGVKTKVVPKAETPVEITIRLVHANGK